MRPTTIIFLVLAIAAALSLASCDTAAADVALSLVINPRTGAASIRNDTGTSSNIDGYLLTSHSNVFNPIWVGAVLPAMRVPGWQQGPAEANRLGEGNLFSSRRLSGGASINLGTPYVPFTPTQIGQLEPALTFEYHVATAEARCQGDVVFAPQNNLVLLIDPVTGNASLQNQSNFDVSIDGLLITSPAAFWIPSVGVGWLRAARRVGPAALPKRIDWAKEICWARSSCRKTALRLPIGKPINASLLDDETDLVFEYHVADGEQPHRRRGVRRVGRDATRRRLQRQRQSRRRRLHDLAQHARFDDRPACQWKQHRRERGKNRPGGLPVWKTNFGNGGSGAGGVAAALSGTSAGFLSRAPGLIGCTFGLLLPRPHAAFEDESG